MITYQEFQKRFKENEAEAVLAVVNDHKASSEYRMAINADEYDHQRNVTIINYQKTIKTLSGVEMIDPFAANYKLPCNIFRRLNTQRTQYSLGGGLTFKREEIKKKLGATFDTVVKKLGYAANIHGVAFGYWNFNRLSIFKLTEFAPLWDENTGALMGGVRFWQLASSDGSAPLHLWLYEVQGITKFLKPREGAIQKLTEKPVKYIKVSKKTPADGETEIEGENYPSLPIIPLWGSELRQSTLVGMRQGIDSYDLIRSGLANDLSDAAYIYWLVTNAGGLVDDDKAKAKLLRELREKHLVALEGDGQNDVQIKPYTQDVPHEARTAYLDRIKAGIYEDFGGLDVHTIAAGATNDHIDAAYQPLDENADDFEYQVIEFTQNLCALFGIDPEEATPIFKRNRVSNQMEQTQMVIAAAAYLDEETVLKKLPFITVDEVKDIIARKKQADMDRYNAGGGTTEGNLEDNPDDGADDQEDGEDGQA